MEPTYSKKKAGRRSKFGGVNEIHEIFFFLFIFITELLSIINTKLLKIWKT